MEPLGIVLIVIIVGAIIFLGKGEGSSSAPSAEDRVEAARQRRSQAYNDVLTDYSAGRISVAQRDAQLGHVSKWPVESGADGRSR